MTFIQGSCTKRPHFCQCVCTAVSCSLHIHCFVVTMCAQLQARHWLHAYINCTQAPSNHTQTHNHAHTNIYTQTHTVTPTYCILIHTHFTYSHTLFIRVRTRTHTHTHTETHTHTHTHTCAHKLQALVYDILPSTTAVFSYAIGSRKLSANEQFSVGAQTVVSLLQTIQIISDICFITDHAAYTSSNKTTII